MTSTTNKSTITSSCCFIEIEPPQSETDELPEWIDSYVLRNINPKHCGSMAKDLNAVLPLRRSTTTSKDSVPDDDQGEMDGVHLPMTDHLKRIRRRPAMDEEISARAKLEEPSNDNNTTKSNQNDDSNDDEPPPKKRAKKVKQTNSAAPWSLDIVVGSVAAVDQSMNENALTTIRERYNLQPSHLTKQSLPGRPAHNRDELDTWNKSIWPTLYYEEKTSQYKEEQMALSSEEVGMMIRGMGEAVKDAIVGGKQWSEWKGSRVGTPSSSAESETMGRKYKEEVFPLSGVVVMNPDSGSVVSCASEERQLQGVMPNNYDASTKKDAADSDMQSASQSACRWISFPDEANPLCTSVLLAIQGVSRNERQIATGCGMESKEFRSGQYLCTGYDVFLTKEPNVYEAMALVHSRVRRVVFGIQDEEMGGLGGVTSNAASRQNSGMHSLPGTNHHYRSFRLDIDNNTGDHGEEVKAIATSLKDIHKV